MTDAIKSLHETWCVTTGQELHFKATERIFWEMAKMEFTADDLLIVLKDVLHYNRTHAHCPMKVQCHKLCSDLEVFASLLASAKAKQRNAIKPLTEKDKTLTAWRGCEPVKNGGNGRHVSEVFEAMRKATNQ